MKYEVGLSNGERKIVENLGDFVGTADPSAYVAWVRPIPDGPPTRAETERAHRVPFDKAAVDQITAIATAVVRSECEEIPGDLEKIERRLSALEKERLAEKPARPKFNFGYQDSPTGSGSISTPPPSTPQAETDRDFAEERAGHVVVFGEQVTGKELVVRRDDFLRELRAAREAALDEAIVAAQPYGGTGVPRAINALRAERERGAAS